MLKLKEKYNNALVKRGTIIFDSSKVNPKHYEIYAKNGFDDLFEVEKVEVVKEKKEESTKKDK